MGTINFVIMATISVVIAIVLVPTIWDAIYVDAAVTTGTGRGINGTTWTILKLVPLIFVGATVIGAVLLGFKEYK